MCNTCSTALREGKLICPECGSHVALTAHTERLAELKKHSRDILSKNLGSAYGLISAIAMSLILLSYLFGVATPFALSSLLIEAIAVSAEFEIPTLLVSLTAVLASLSSLFFMIAPLLSTIGYWQLYAKKDGHTPQQLKRSRAFSTLQSVLSIISIVFGSIACAAMLIASLIVFVSTGFSAAGIITLVSAVIGIAIVIVLLCQHSAMWSGIRGYHSRLILLSAKGIYSELKPPCVRLWIFGILYTAVNPCISFYLILSAIRYRSLHAELLANEQAIKEETALCESVKQATEEALRTEEKQRRLDEAESLAQLKRENLEQQQQLQQMMQQMMQQQMAADGAAPAAEDTPSAENVSGAEDTPATEGTSEQ